MVPKKNPHAVALGRLGGQARAKRLTKKQREEIARNAAHVRSEKISIEKQQQIVVAAGKLGGAARAAKLTPAQRKRIAAKAAAARWAKKKPSDKNS